MTKLTYHEVLIIYVILPEKATCLLPQIEQSIKHQMQKIACKNHSVFLTTVTITASGINSRFIKNVISQKILKIEAQYWYQNVRNVQVYIQLPYIHMASSQYFSSYIRKSYKFHPIRTIYAN